MLFARRKRADLRLLILSINYAPEPTGFSQHVTRLSEYLGQKGADVTVVTGFPFAPAWKKWPEYRGRLSMRQYLNGVDVIRVTHFVPRRPRSVIQRLLMEASYCFAAALQFVRCRRPDVILYVGAQPSIAFLARIAAFLMRRPYALWINDLAAEAARDVKMIRGRFLPKVLARFEYMAYRRAAGAVVLCESFRGALVAHQFPLNRIRVIGSPINVDNVRPTEPGPLRQSLGISSETLVILYAGSMGIKQGLLNVTSAAKLTSQAGADIVWILIGEGEMRTSVLSAIERDRLGHAVKLLPLQPESALAQTLSSADMLLLNQVADVKDTVIPSKLLTYMAAGKPVLAAVNAQSEAASLVRDARGGIVVAPEDPRALADAALTLRSRGGELKEMGTRNREWAVTHFDERKVFASHLSFLNEIVSSANKSRETTL
jgi:colanic acid biosynthesis glycosyl transferase WcaI